MWYVGDGMGWWMVWGGLMMVLFWGGIIALIVWTVQSLTRREDGGGSPARHGARRWTLPGSATPAATSRVRSLSRSRETWRGPDGIRTWRRKPSATLLRKEQGGPPGTV